MEWSKLKESTEAFKNIFVILLYIVFTIFFFDSIFPKIKTWEPKKISFYGVEYGPKEKESQKMLDASNVNVKKPKDSSVKQNLIDAAKLVDTTINLGSRNWVYLGQMVNGILTFDHFGLKNLPIIGEQITAQDAVYKRKDLPIQLKNSDWKLGDIKGVVKGGESVKVLAVQKIEDENYWAFVE